ncbi:MAG: DUF4411 family protein [Candidatus Melainabacteria bacterium]|nr:DUF4411 family protein [Candidatus Melainabacteria bacterium]
MRKYSLDTSGLIDAYTRYYPPDTFKGLWVKLSESAFFGYSYATKMVRTELEKEDDDLLKWCDAQDAFFKEVDEAIQRKVADILTTHPMLVKAGSGRSGADPFVIALAELTDATVITGEIFGSASKPKIPDVCRDRGVKCGNVLHMIKSEGWTF